MPKCLRLSYSRRRFFFSSVKTHFGVDSLSCFGSKSFCITTSVELQMALYFLVKCPAKSYSSPIYAEIEILVGYVRLVVLTMGFTGDVLK